MARNANLPTDDTQEPVRVETTTDGGFSYHLGDRELQPGDVVELFVRAGPHTQWKEATFDICPGYPEAELRTNRGVYSLTADSQIPLRWPVKPDAAAG